MLLQMMANGKRPKHSAQFLLEVLKQLRLNPDDTVEIRGYMLMVNIEPRHNLSFASELRLESEWIDKGNDHGIAKAEAAGLIEAVFAQLVYKTGKPRFDLYASAPTVIYLGNVQPIYAHDLARIAG